MYQFDFRKFEETAMHTGQTYEKNFFIDTLILHIAKF